MSWLSASIHFARSIATAIAQAPHVYEKWSDVASCGRSDQMWPVVALAPPLQTLQIPCRFAAIACRPLADPPHIPAAPLPFLSRPLQVSCMSLGYSLGVLLAPVLQFPCGSPAGALQGIDDPLQAELPQARSPLAVSLRIPSRSPLQSSGGVSAVPLHAIRRTIKIPCRQGPRRHLAVPLEFPCGPLQISCRALAVLFRSFLRFPAIPSHISWRCPASPLAVSLQFPCRFPAILLQSPCGSLADSLQVQPGSFLAVGLQRSSRPPAVVSPRATFIPPQPLAVHPAMKCIACFAAAGRPFCIVLEP